MNLLEKIIFFSFFISIPSFLFSQEISLERLNIENTGIIFDACVGNDNIFYVATQQGTFSNSVNSSFTKLNSGPILVTKVFSNSLDDIFFWGYEKNVPYLSIDSAKNWFILKGLPQSSVIATALDSKDLIYVGTDYNYAKEPYVKGALFISSDSAKSWKKLLDDVIIKDIQVINDDNIFVLTNKSLIFSTDNGNSFIPIVNDNFFVRDNIGLVQKEISCFYVTNDGNIIIATIDHIGAHGQEYNASLFESNDLGKKWTKISGPDSNDFTAFSSIVFKNGRILLCQYNGVFMLKNKVINKIVDLPAQKMKIFPNGVIILITNKGIYTF